MRFSRLDEWLTWLETLHPKKIDLGLERVAAVAERLGLIPPVATVITVAGTNGKGSSVAMMDAILRADGRRTGCYTSPHIHRYNERITIDGHSASDGDIVAAFAAIDTARLDISLSYFEFGTLAALWLFARERVDIIILEVGLGGRLDAVNIVDADIALVTSIGLDHVEWLGDSRDVISLEKVAIGRSDRPLVCGEPDPPAPMRAFVHERGMVGRFIGEDFTFSAGGQRWDWHGNGYDLLQLPLPALAGAHQMQNAAAVLSVLTSLPAHLIPSRRAVETGLVQVQLAGRFERMEIGFEVILDVSHNPHGMQKLVALLQESPVEGRTFVLFGVMADKDIDGLIQLMLPVVDEWIIVAPDFERALPATDLLQRVVANDAGINASLHGSVRDGLAFAKTALTASDRLLVTGSFYTVAEVRELLI